MISERRALLIFNPRTGRYKARRPLQADSVCDYLRRHQIEVEPAATAGPGHAADLARRAIREGYTEVIVCGGDGTINEAVQGLAGSDLRLGIIARGTGNVLARELQLPLHSRQAMKVIAAGHTRGIYLGCAIDDATKAKRYFFLMAGIGLDASVVSQVRPGLKKRIGKAAFWYSGLRHLTGWEPIPFAVMVDGHRYDATFAAIGKSARYGGNLSVTPRARLDDPSFEICLVESRSRLRYLQLLSHVMRGGIPADKPGIRFLHATRARAEGTVGVQVDGELIGQLPMSFEIARHSLEVIVSSTPPSSSPARRPSARP